MRLEVLDRLNDGEQCVCELMETMKTAQSKPSFHLRVLKKAGLLEDRREGRWIYCSLNRESFEKLEELLTDLKPNAKAARSSTICY